MAEEAKPRLGRGLAALIGNTAIEDDSVEQSRGQKKVPIEFIRPNPSNPRKNFSDHGLDELAESIKEKGIIQPIVVRSNSDVPDIYEIIAGERRWRAAQRAGLHDVPVVVAQAGERESLELAIIENVQREDLNSIDEARGYEQLASEFGYTQLDLARIIGKSRSHIANTLRLLKLPESARVLLEGGQITAGHGRALLASSDPEALAKRIINEKLSVREAEQIAQSVEGKDQSATKTHKKKRKDADIIAMENTLAEQLGMVVQINNNGSKGSITIQYTSLEQFEYIDRRLRG